MSVPALLLTTLREGSIVNATSRYPVSRYGGKPSPFTDESPRIVSSTMSPGV
jgi:hypothetical protein